VANWAIFRPLGTENNTELFAPQYGTILRLSRVRNATQR